ncbi:MAG: helix-hairpin-helix domain-containing protein [Sinomicrobium sp.]|nr:helix-hairpin-helix domain-containing protein [Sinomicrobium sp.]
MLFLVLCIVALQCIYFFVDLTPGKIPADDDPGWMAFQHTIDSLKQVEAERRKPVIYPFNPNYITDYKGYTLGMSPEETDRLLHYRKSGKFVNSAGEFQQVTRISDSLLAVLQPYFKFPDWVTPEAQPLKKKPQSQAATRTDTVRYAAKKDINTATAEALKAIPGIGEVLSERIIKFRDRLGGFLVNEQLYDVYGLSAETADNILKRYTVLTPPRIRKININTAGPEALSSVAYIRYKAARAIIRYRDSVGKIRSFEELTKIPYIPIEKIDRIKLYLDIE